MGISEPVPDKALLLTNSEWRVRRFKQINFEGNCHSYSVTSFRLLAYELAPECSHKPVVWPEKKKKKKKNRNEGKRRGRESKNGGGEGGGQGGRGLVLWLE